MPENAPTKSTRHDRIPIKAVKFPHSLVGWHNTLTEIQAGKIIAGQKVERIDLDKSTSPNSVVFYIDGREISFALGQGCSWEI